MNIGRLRHRVTLQRLAKSRNDFGETVDQWDSYATRWAEVKPISGKEQYASAQVLASATIEVWLRFWGEIKVTDRVVDHRGNALDIVSVQDVGGKGVIMKLLCQELPV